MSDIDLSKYVGKTIDTIHETIGNGLLYIKFTDGSEIVVSSNQYPLSTSCVIVEEGVGGVYDDDLIELGLKDPK